jgi:hypothetical protein
MTQKGAVGACPVRYEEIFAAVLKGRETAKAALHKDAEAVQGWRKAEF